MPTLTQLSHFRKLARTEHMTRTAQSLMVSQTALSNTIAHLEKELGVQLFDRPGRGIRLNAYGEAYLAHVDRIFTELENGSVELRNMSGRGESRISIAMTSSYLWSDAIEGFKRRHPACVILQHEGHPGSFREQLDSGEVDFIIAGEEDFPTRGLAREFCREERVVLTLPPEHRLAGRDSIALIELADEPFVSLSRDAPFRIFCDKLCLKAGFVPNTVAECDYMLRPRLLRDGYGVCLTTQTAADMQFLGPMRYIPISDDYALRRVSLFWSPGRTFSAVAESFREYMAALYNTV